jgi:hypothetical protein
LFDGLEHFGVESHRLQLPLSRPAGCEEAAGPVFDR